MNSFVEALHATGPALGHEVELMLFGQFVGSWKVEWVGNDTTDNPTRVNGELHFGWVLGGRAVQDTWIVPGRGESHLPAFRAFHGTTVRFYDPTIDAWRSTWIEPINARVRRFIGRYVDGDIVLLSDEDQPQLRWRFTDIEEDAATWRGEVSYDDGATWVLEEEMQLTRIK
jgi:hypothetical protein